MGVLQNRCGDFVLAWNGLLADRKMIKLWNLVLGCVIWSLWYERNKAKFEDYEPNLQRLVFTLKVRVGMQAMELLGYRDCSPLEFMNNIEDITNKGSEI